MPCAARAGIESDAGALRDEVVAVDYRTAQPRAAADTDEVHDDAVLELGTRLTASFTETSAASGPSMG